MAGQQKENSEKEMEKNNNAEEENDDEEEEEEEEENVVKYIDVDPKKQKRAVLPKVYRLAEEEAKKAEEAKEAQEQKEAQKTKKVQKVQEAQEVENAEKTKKAKKAKKVNKKQNTKKVNRYLNPKERVDTNETIETIDESDESDDTNETEVNKTLKNFMALFNPEFESEEEVQRKQELRLQEIVKQIKDNSESKGRVLRSVKNRGQSSKLKEFREMKDENELEEMVVRSHVNDTEVIHNLWETNYGMTKDRKQTDRSISSLAKHQTNFKGSKKLSEEQKQSERLREKRKRCRYRKELALSLFHKTGNE